MKSQVYKIRLKKDDNIVVIAGKHKGKTGKVSALHPTLGKVSVPGINVVKKHTKPTKTNPQGGIIEVVKPIDVSKVAIVEPTSKKPSRIGYKLTNNGKKVRVYKRNGKEIK